MIIKPMPFFCWNMPWTNWGLTMKNKASLLSSAVEKPIQSIGAGNIVDLHTGTGDHLSAKVDAVDGETIRATVASSGSDLFKPGQTLVFKVRHVWAVR